MGASECAGVPGVSSVLPDENFESENKDYAGNPKFLMHKPLAVALSSVMTNDSSWQSTSINRLVFLYI
ncbi:hypothetical protein CJ030_MR1G015690 [Morella rubra]|uniref:Uncharacterized protein n=1 Tax=Morella rubra TaxID=262757 RepID=A0A6A1WRH2_9ROSI|nr:hypothetical protein CJ030_MR1G015690 [Morella rubra]